MLSHALLRSLFRKTFVLDDFSFGDSCLIDLSRSISDGIQTRGDSLAFRSLHSTTESADWSEPLEDVLVGVSRDFSVE